MAKDYVLEKRKYVIGGVALAIVLIYLVRLFSLQIATDDYKKNADSNAFLNKIQYPSRGAMYDRNDKLLVFNQPAYDITMVPKEVENLDTLDLCQTLNITRAQFLRIMSDMKDRRRNPGYSRYTNQVFMSQLSAEECGVFQEKLFKFRGFYIQRRTIRQYSYNSAAHVLGDIGEVSMKDIENDDTTSVATISVSKALKNRMNLFCAVKREWKYCCVMPMGAYRGIIWMGSMINVRYPGRI